MSSKTKIVVFHMKELIYTGIFILLGIILLVLLISMFTPEKEPSTPNVKISTTRLTGGLLCGYKPLLPASA